MNLPKLTFFILSILLLFNCDGSNAIEIISQEPCGGVYSTANILTEIDENIYNNDESVNANSFYSWSSDETNRLLNGNGIPNHEVGPGLGTAPRTASM